MATLRPSTLKFDPLVATLPCGDVDSEDLKYGKSEPHKDAYFARINNEPVRGDPEIA